MNEIPPSFDRASVMAEDSLIDRSQVKYPSHSYYIMFDKAKGGGFKENMKNAVLERKVERLEKEVQEMRSSNLMGRTTHKDGKMRMEQLINSMIG